MQNASERLVALMRSLHLEVKSKGGGRREGVKGRDPKLAGRREVGGGVKGYMPGKDAGGRVEGGEQGRGQQRGLRQGS